MKDLNSIHLLILDAISRDKKRRLPLDAYPRPFRQFLNSKYEKIITGFEDIWEGLFTNRWLTFKEDDIKRKLHSLLLSSRVYLYTLEELHLIELKRNLIGKEEYFITTLGKAVLEFVP